MGLAMGVVVTDENEAKLPIPKKYGIDEFPLFYKIVLSMNITNWIIGLSTIKWGFLAILR